MGDTANGSWGSRELGGYIRREEARKERAEDAERKKHARFEAYLMVAGGVEQVDRRGAGRSILHGHTCARCGKLRTCLQEPCRWRAREGRENDAEWICFKCLENSWEGDAT